MLDAPGEYDVQRYSSLPQLSPPKILTAFPENGEPPDQRRIRPNGDFPQMRTVKWVGGGGNKSFTVHRSTSNTTPQTMSARGKVGMWAMKQRRHSYECPSDTSKWMLVCVFVCVCVCVTPKYFNQCSNCEVQHSYTSYKTSAKP